MRDNVALIFITLLLSYLSEEVCADQPNCLITSKTPTKPNPSLIQCYKNNPNSCCNSVSDSYIKNEYDKLLTPSCQRNYEFLERYFCLACSPSEPSATNHATKQVKICRSLMENIWKSDINSPTTVFDNCGMYSAWNTTVNPILPSKLIKKEFTSASDFVTKVKPPFFEGYTITIVDDSQGGCYKSAYNLTFWGIFLVLFISLLIL